MPISAAAAKGKARRRRSRRSGDVVWRDAMRHERLDQGSAGRADGDVPARITQQQSFVLELPEPAVHRSRPSRSRSVKSGRLTGCGNASTASITASAFASALMAGSAFATNCSGGGANAD